MKWKFIILSFIAIYLCGIDNKMYGQVTIGSDLEPGKGALLDMKEFQYPTPIPNVPTKNSDKGLLFPKVDLQGRKSLKPLINESVPEDSVRTTGMVVYNTSPTAIAEGVGLYVWNGKEWSPLSAPKDQGQAEFETPFDCSKLRVEGTYALNTPLNPLTNYIEFEVTVTKPGMYSASALPVNANENNGYYFTGSGLFVKTGTYILRLPGIGTPQVATGSGDANEFQVRINDLNACTASVNVDGTLLEYRVICGSITVNGTYEAAADAENSNNYMTFLIDAPVSSMGTIYQINTDVVNNFYFDGSGTISGGRQEVKLYAHGTPAKGDGTGGIQTFFTINTNSMNQQSTPCEVGVKVIGSQSLDLVKIASFGGYWYNAGSTQKNENGMYLFLNNKNLFGSTAPVKVNGFQFVTGTGVGNLPKNYDASKLRNLINNPSTAPDIIIGGYEWADLEGKISDELMDVLAQYIEQGGVFIYSNDMRKYDDGDRRNRNTQTLLDKLFGNGGYRSSNLWLDGGFDGPDYLNFASDHPIIKGDRFGYDITPYRWQRELGWQSSVKTIGAGNPDMVILIGGGENIRGIVHKTKPFVFIGDGGVFTYIKGNNDAFRFPMKMNDQNMPIVRTSNNTAHSYLFLNIMDWALREVVKRGGSPFNIQ